MTIEGHKQNWLGLAMRLILVVVIFAMISMRLDLSRAGEVLSRTDLRLASVAFALFVLNRLLTAIKWGMLLRCGGVHVRLSRLVRIMFESNLPLLPTRFAMEVHPTIDVVDNTSREFRFHARGDGLPSVLQALKARLSENPG